MQDVLCHETCLRLRCGRYMAQAVADIVTSIIYPYKYIVLPYVDDQMQPDLGRVCSHKCIASCSHKCIDA
jgi:hypothetical protein